LVLRPCSLVEEHRAGTGDPVFGSRSPTGEPIAGTAGAHTEPPLEIEPPSPDARIITAPRAGEAASKPLPLVICV
jgi:hypothetical protein